MVMYWVALLAISILIYLLLDGFDLGVGMLFGVAGSEAQRDAMLSTVAPVWDGNETWLIVTGVIMWGSFPLVYAMVLSAFYIPVLVMLLGLILRGVAFEFRGKAHRSRWIWDVSFVAGSFAASFMQGAMVGALVEGLQFSNGDYTGGTLGWLTAFSALCGIGLCFGYALLGACWLNWKTEGALQERAARHAWRLGWLLLAVIGLVSLMTLGLEAQYYRRWITYPGLIATGPVPIATVFVTAMFYRSLAKKQEAAPFFWTLGLFGLCIVGLGVSIWPDVIPARVTIWQAAAPERSQVFMLIGAVIMLPIILAYTGWAYWVFRGKVGEGYH